ncbi:hypothetical protein Efla_005482 [Eimeria flavescens]
MSRRKTTNKESTRVFPGPSAAAADAPQNEVFERPLAPPPPQPQRGGAVKRLCIRQLRAASAVSVSACFAAASALLSLRAALHLPACVAEAANRDEYNAARGIELSNTRRRSPGTAGVPLETPEGVPSPLSDLGASGRPIAAHDFSGYAARGPPGPGVSPPSYEQALALAPAQPLGPAAPPEGGALDGQTPSGSGSYPPPQSTAAHGFSAPSTGGPPGAAAASPPVEQDAGDPGISLVLFPACLPSCCYAGQRPVIISTFPSPIFPASGVDIASPLLTPSSPVSFNNELVFSVEAAIAESHVSALQDPAGHCKSREKETTHFCTTLREFAAAALAAQQLEGATCVFSSLKERKVAEKLRAKAGKDSAKGADQVQPVVPGKEGKKGSSFSLPFGSSKKGQKQKGSGKRGKQKLSSGESSFLQMPTEQEQEARNEEAAKAYAANVAEAQKKAGGPEGGPAGALDAAILQVFDALLLTGMAKELLSELVQAALGAPEGYSIWIDPNEMEGVLRSVLVQGSAYAQPLAPFCAYIIQTALNSISSKTQSVDEAKAAALLALTSFDALVCDAAKMKAAHTAENMGENKEEGNAAVRALAGRHQYSGLPESMALQVLDVVLSVIDNPNGVTVVEYAKSAGPQAEGPAAQVTPAPPAPSTDAAAGQGSSSEEAAAEQPMGAATPPSSSGTSSSTSTTAADLGAGPESPAPVAPEATPSEPGGSAASASEGPAASTSLEGAMGGQAGGPRAARRSSVSSQAGAPSLGPQQAAAARPAPLSMPTVRLTVDASLVPVPGLVGTEVRLISLPFFQQVGQRSPYGTRFHGALTDYTMGYFGTPHDVCITDSMVLPMGGLGFRRGEGPPQTMGALAASVVERWALRRAREAVEPSVTLFRDTNAIKSYAEKLLKKHIQMFKGAAAPAPSFHSLMSSSCKSYADDARRLFHDQYTSSQLFQRVKQSTQADSQLRVRAQLLRSQGKRVPEDLSVSLFIRRLCINQLTSAASPCCLHACSAAVIKYGFLDVCDISCYRREKSRRADVLGSVIFSLNHTLTRLNTMAYKALTISGALFGGLTLKPFSGSTTQQQSQKALSAMLSLWAASSEKAKTKDSLPAGAAESMEEYALALELYANYLAGSPETKEIYNLAAHTWVQLRGIHNAAEGFMPGKGAKISERNKQVAAVFAKLWFEADSATVHSATSPLKHFPAMLASVALQVAFFLHSVLGEYKSNIWKRFGAAVLSFFPGLFRRDKRMKMPGSWKQLEAQAQPKAKTNIKSFQGALKTIAQLAKAFHERFLKQAIDARDSNPLLPAYVAFIHGLVAQWMNPHSGSLSLSDPTLSKAKKLFYYHVFVHREQPLHLSLPAVSPPAGMGTLDVGKVRATVGASGKRQVVGSSILKMKPVSVKGSALDFHLNMLLETYDDPFDIIRVAEDLATRCLVGEGGPAFLETDAGNGEKKKKGFSFPKFSFKKRKDIEPNGERLVQILSSKFVLDLWCLKYRGKPLSTLTEVPRTTDSEKLVASLEEALDATNELVLASAGAATSWVLNVKCPFMRDFVDVELRTRARREMMQYAISRRGLGKRLRRKLRAIKNWFTKKFNWKRKQMPGMKADNEWAVIHAGTSKWDAKRKRYEHTLTFRPEAMSCDSNPEGKQTLDFLDGRFSFGGPPSLMKGEAVLCVKNEVYCWATRRALMFKGSTEVFPFLLDYQVKIRQLLFLIASTPPACGIVGCPE